MTKFQQLNIAFLLLFGVLSKSLAQSSETLTFATGTETGMYSQFASLLAEQLKANGDINLQVVHSAGSGENAQLVAQGKVDFAIVQTGVVSFKPMQVVTPLFVEPLIILVNAKAGVNYLSDLRGRSIDLGPKGSGSRLSGERILEHYEIIPGKMREDFNTKTGPHGSEFDVKFMVTGLLNQSLKRRIRIQGQTVMAIKDAAAISLKYPHLQTVTIPRGIFSSNPSVPLNDIQTLASTAILVAAKHVSQESIELVLKQIYHSELKSDFPLLMTPSEVKSWSLFPLKPASTQFLDPYSGLGVFSAFAESIAAIKEIIFAFIAAGYFSWLGLKRIKARKEQALFSELKEQLDVYLDETVRLERLYLQQNSISQLQQTLQKLVDNKLNALEQLTNEKLRGDNLFAIFIAQSSNLILRIEQKIENLKRIQPLID